jgi:hypothetical protein
VLRAAIDDAFRETFAAVAPRRAAAIALLAFCVYALGAHWGLPDGSAGELIHAWGVDDEAPMGALGQLYGIVRDNPDANLGYPLMHPMLVGAVSAPYLLYRWSAGDLRPVQQEHPFGFEDPRRALRMLSWFAHLLSSLLAAGVVVAAYVTGATWWDERAGLWAAAFMLLCYPMFYYGRTANVDMTMLFWAVVSYTVILNSGFSPVQAVILGAATGAAVATKEPAAAAFVLLPVAIAVRHLGQLPRDHWQRWQTWKPFVIAAASTFVVFGFGSGLFLAPTRFFAHLEFMRTRLDEAATMDLSWVIRFPPTLQGNVEMLAAVSGYLARALTAVGLGLGVAGILWAAIRRQRSLLLVLPMATWLGVLFLSARVVQLRYFLPPAFVLAVFAGGAMYAASRSQTRILRNIALAAASFALVLGLFRGANLTVEMLDDSRHDATAWLAASLPPGSRLDFFGPYEKLPHLPPGVAFERAIEYYGALVPPALDAPAAAAVARRWRTSPPDAVIIIPDYLSAPGSEIGGACPPAVFDALMSGELGFELAAKFTATRLVPFVGRPPLDYPTVSPPIWIFVPSGRSEEP